MSRHQLALSSSKELTNWEGPSSRMCLCLTGRGTAGLRSSLADGKTPAPSCRSLHRATHSIAFRSPGVRVRRKECEAAGKRDRTLLSEPPLRSDTPPCLLYSMHWKQTGVQHPFQWRGYTRAERLESGITGAIEELALHGNKSKRRDGLF